MCDSLYFNLLFHRLSDKNGHISFETLTKLSHFYPGNKDIDISNLYDKWRKSPQIWCLNTCLTVDANVKVVGLDTVSKGEDSRGNSKSKNETEDITMTIHVCDEPKNLKRDFQCQKDLLVREMKYFADYLSSESQSAADVDISVHCDVNIFEWLMKYVRRDQLPINERVSVASMKPNNAISILISSDFLKMDSLVGECIDYIHENINTILSSSFNVNCVNPYLISRIAARFSDMELGNILDKRDKIKSTLYKKKIEGLFDAASAKKEFTMAPATQLFKCIFCEKILMRGFDQRINCLESRLCIGATGAIIYCHGIDESWGIQNQMSDWVQEYRSNNRSIAESTVMLYWRLWAHLNCVECETCSQIFPLFEIGHCRYHPESPNFGKDDSKGVIPIVQGMYNCCGMLTLRFDPFRLNKGCKVKDHIVKLSTNGMKYTDEEAHLDKILDVLAHHRSLFEVPFQSSACDRDFVSGIMGRDNLISRGKATDCILKDDDDNERMESVVDNFPRPRLEPLIRHFNKIGPSKKSVITNVRNSDDLEEDVGESEDVDHDETLDSNVHNESSQVTIKTGAILLDAPQFPVFKSKKWDNNKSLRYNQDSQRQEDLRRMRQILNYLISLRINIDKCPKPKTKEAAGGIYCQLEQQWRADIAERNAAAAANLMSQRTLSTLKIKQKPSGGMQPFK